MSCDGSMYNQHRSMADPRLFHEWTLDARTARPPSYCGSGMCPSGSACCDIVARLEDHGGLAHWAFCHGPQAAKFHAQLPGLSSMCLGARGSEWE